MTIDEFLASPSSSFEDVTDNVLARGGPKKLSETEVDDVEVVSGSGGEGGSDGSDESVEAVVEVGGEGDSSAIDSAADGARTAELNKEVESPVVMSPAVESIVEDVDVEVDPEPSRRRRRR